MCWALKTAQPFSTISLHTFLKVKYLGIRMGFLDNALGLSSLLLFFLGILLCLDVMFGTFAIVLALCGRPLWR